MKIYTLFIGGIPLKTAHTSLSVLCREHKLSYYSATHDIRSWNKRGIVYEIFEFELQKHPRRGYNSGNKDIGKPKTPSSEPKSNQSNQMDMLSEKKGGKHYDPTTADISYDGD